MSLKFGSNKFVKLIGLAICFLAFGGLYSVFGQENAKYDKLFVWITPENPWQKTPEITISEQDITTLLKKGHPRLFMTDSLIAKVREQSKTDELLARYIREVIDQANASINSGEPRNDRELMKRIFEWGFAYRWSGDIKYLEPAKNSLLKLSGRNEWDWFHFLGAGEASAVSGIGYDIFYNGLDEQSRKQIVHGMIKNGLNPGVAAYSGAPFGWFKDVHHNWNQVCNSGLVIAALAIAEEGDDNLWFSKYIVPRAVRSLAMAMNEYAPDGSYPEGPGYWGFGTSYAILGLEALRNSLGTDFGLSKFKGFDQTFYYQWYVTGTSGNIMSFADASPNSNRTPNGLMLWMAKQFGDQVLANNEHNLLKASGKKAGTYDVMFYVPPTKDSDSALPLDRYFRGPVEVVAMRTSWTDKNGLFIGLKAGYSQANHGHLDLGNFEMDALGERWFYDLGGDDYYLPEYFNMNATRWNYYRTGSKSHNVPLIDKANQYCFATSKFIKTDLNIVKATATVDLTEAYKGFVTLANRSVAMDKKAGTITIEDFFDLTDEHTIIWGATTDAKITVKGNSALLEQKGKKLSAKIIYPSKAQFYSESAEQLPPEKKNEKVNRLMVDLKGQKGENRITIILKPIGKN